MKNINTFGIATLMLISMLTIMVGSVISPSLIAINDNLNFQFDSGLLITLPSLGVVLFSSITGGLLKKLGSFKLLCLGLVPYAIFGFGGAFLHNSYLLIADRLLLGAAAVAVQIAATAIIAENFLGAHRMKIIAWQGMAIEGGGVLFLSLGGLLGEMHWSYPFYIYLIALICLLLSFLLLPKHAPDMTEQTKDKPETTHTNEKYLVFSIFLGSLFAMIIFFVSFIHLPEYLPKTFQFSESKTGYVMAGISFIAVITASQMPKIARAISSGATVAIGFLFFMIGYFIFGVGNTEAFIYAGACMLGIGFGLSIPTLNHMMVEVSSFKSRGKNLGLYSIGVFGGQFLSTFLGFIFVETTTLFLATGCIALVICLLLFILFRKYPL
ncbi:Predicted arabinose efflux permease, MFS family [Pustulibacterium marinum]|uniref:Predicted arabinose efflux permease, MFS family n=1 Tax=Pustulibacterium marinum TaxID=1224947 RepID=A0A1I7GW25_9FLAO|nr:MFS transporter [Pustulibacterium marinum]SFU52631.1 Predicted arabinose efflux permease, MFS family [Pustulibacterium marinum]